MRKQEENPNHGLMNEIGLWANRDMKTQEEEDEERRLTKNDRFSVGGKTKVTLEKKYYGMAQVAEVIPGGLVPRKKMEAVDYNTPEEILIKKEEELLPALKEVEDAQEAVEKEREDRRKEEFEEKFEPIPEVYGAYSTEEGITPLTSDPIIENIDKNKDEVNISKKNPEIIGLVKDTFLKMKNKFLFRKKGKDERKGKKVEVMNSKIWSDKNQRG